MLQDMESSLSTFKEPEWQAVRQPRDVKVLNHPDGLKTYYDVKSGIWKTKL